MSVVSLMPTIHLKSIDASRRTAQTDGADLALGVPHDLFDWPALANGPLSVASFDVSPDG